MDLSHLWHLVWYLELQNNLSCCMYLCVHALKIEVISYMLDIILHVQK